MDNTDDVAGLKLELIGLLVKAGKPYDLATEAVNTLGLGADWDELIHLWGRWGARGPS